MAAAALSLALQRRPKETTLVKGASVTILFTFLLALAKGAAITF